MAGRKLLRYFLISKQPLYRQLVTSSQDSISTSRIRLLAPHSYSGNRQLSFFENLSEQVREEAKRNPELEQSLKEMKKKAEELKGVKEDLKVRLGRHFQWRP